MKPPDGLWHFEYITPDLVQGERKNGVVYKGKTKYQDVMVMDGACFGRSLILDGKTQSTELDEFVYHEAIVHPSMLAHPSPRTIFVAGGGEGATIREVMSHNTVAKVVMVDIDEKVVQLCKQHLPQHHKGAFDDPRLELHHTDALAFLENTTDRFDILIIDVPDPLEQGPASQLFTKNFYQLAKSRLNPEGVMVAQSGPTGPSFYEQCFTAVAKTVASVFPSAYPYEIFVPSFGSTWGFVMGSTGPDPTSLTDHEINSRVKTRVAKTLKFYDGITQRGMFSLPKFLREGIVNETRIITDENPLFVI